PYAIRDFPRGLFELGESSSARDLSHVDGLASWALRRDLKASRAQARVMEAELGTCETKIALLKSKDKIGEKERELLNHDLENVEHALGNVLERMSVLENEENATLKKRLAETETKLVWACMECETTKRRIMLPKAISEARMREVIREQVAASMAEFVANMNRGTGGARTGGTRTGGVGAGGAKAGGAGVGGSGPAAPEITGCCALTWWNGRIASMGIDDANGTSWTEVRKWMTEEFYPPSVLQRLEQELYNLKLKGTDIDGYTNQFHELALLYPRMPADIDEAVRIAYQLMGQIIQDKTDEVYEGEKRKGEGDCGGHGDNRRDYNRWQNQRRANAGAMTNA
ncbi:putative reverse transcriptase domain-containing protein, partial [Tanacetum coccineum]